MSSIAILIPTYKPEESLIQLILEIRKLLPRNKIFIVRDGIFPEQETIIQYTKLIPGVFIISHAINLGKGRALKTGFNEILINHPEISGVVTADADGQHTPGDIVKIASSIKNENTLILGSRFKNMDNTPIKSKIGNKLTRLIFKLLIGLNLRDTQTGLRGIPTKIIRDTMTISGERYEFETNTLIKAKQENWPITEIDIQTVYINQNRGSHFNPIIDSMRIYFLIFRFFFSSIATSIIDFLIFSILASLKLDLKVAITGSRLIAGLFNFTVNKKIVFKNKAGNSSAALKYWLLVGFMACISYLGTKAISKTGINIYLSKILVEASLFAFSFIIQRDLIFDNKDSHEND